jgi:hypothetical protein
MKKNVLLFLLPVLIYSSVTAQSVGIGTTTPDANAILHLESSNKGLLLPATSSFIRTSMVAPPAGLLLYDFNSKSLWTRGATDWQEIRTNSNSPWVENGDNLYRSIGFVGIGTSDPYNKLHLHTSLSDSTFIRFTNSVTGNGLNGFIAGNKGNNAALLNLENGNLFIGTNNDSLVTIASNRRMGIGIKTPTAKLQVNGSGISSTLSPAILITDSLPNAGGLLKFRQVTNNTGMSLSLYSDGGFNNDQFLDLRSDSLTVATFAGNGRLGVRNLSPGYTLDVGGDINTNGLIRVNGSSGTAGQVLTSNGAADPAWQNLPESYPVADRVMIPLLATPLPSALTLPLTFGSPHYNLNPTNLAAGLTTVTINTTGLYEVEGAVRFNTGSVTVTAGTNPIGALWLRTVSGATTNDYTLIRERIDQVSVSSPSFLETIPFKLKLHIVAGTVISLRGLIYQYSTGSSMEIDEGYLGIVRIN